MKLSPSALIVVIVMSLLVVALIILAFFLGGQYASTNISKSLVEQIHQTQSTSTLPQVETPISVPPMILPQTPRSSWSSLDMWLRGTVLRASPLTFGNEVALALNSSEINRGAVADKNAVYIYFTDVVYDSRCPEDVLCIAAGEAIVEVELKAYDKPTKTVYLSTQTGGKPDLWSYHGIQDDSFITPDIKAEIARGQKIVSETTYVKGEAYNSGGAVVDGYIISLRGLTPNRTNQGDAPIPKNDFRATFVVKEVPKATQ